MSCGAENYKAAWNFLVTWSDRGVQDLTYQFGNKALALLLIAAVMIPVTVAFGYVGKVFVPKVANWYLDQTITEKAKEYYRNHCIGTGFTHGTAIIAIAAGAAYYILIRIVAAFPSHYFWGASALVIGFLAVHALGCFVAGNVPENVAKRRKYYKRFQIPTITSLGLAVGTIALDFMINGAILALTYLEDALEGVKIVANL